MLSAELVRLQVDSNDDSPASPTQSMSQRRKSWGKLVSYRNLKSHNSVLKDIESDRDTPNTSFRSTPNVQSTCKARTLGKSSIDFNEVTDPRVMNSH